MFLCKPELIKTDLAEALLATFSESKVENLVQVQTNLSSG